MRIALITGVLVLALATTSLADVSITYSRHNTDYSYDYGLSFGDPFYDPVALGRNNDRGGFRAFIPRGQQGREYYNMGSSYNGGSYYRRNNYSHGGGYHRNYYHPSGGYTVLQGQPYWDGYGYSYGYGAPTYIYPGRSAIVIDPNGSDYAPQPPGDVYNDNRVYDNDVYDNSTTVNNYGPQLPQGALPARPQAAPVKPKAEPIGPQQPSQRSTGMRFAAQGRINTPDGARVYKIENGVLYTAVEGGKQVKVADGVDEDFGGYALMQPSLGSAVLFRQGDKLAAAYPTEKGWWVEALPYRVDFGRHVNFSLMSGEPWVTFTATDGTRWVVKLSNHQWLEVGSGTT